MSLGFKRLIIVLFHTLVHRLAKMAWTGNQLSSLTILLGQKYWFFITEN